MAYSGTNTVGTPVTNFVAGNTLYAGCGNCVSQTSPCPPVPACVVYQCVYGAASACAATCGVAGVTIRTATCMAYSGGSTNGVAVANFDATNTLYAGCGNCVSQTSPCPPVPACVTYGCVYSQASSCVATCMSYTGGSTVGVPVTTSNFGNFAGCGNCVSQTSPCPPLPPCVTYQCSYGSVSACSV